MMNHIIKDIDAPLTESYIKSLHYDLKSGVFEDRANGYAVGEYKTRPNRVSTIQTTPPEHVPRDMANLLLTYHKAPISLESLARFHAEYEHIHPFQDGNGRTGRAILVKEALANNILPPVIRDENKVNYYYALHDAQVTGDQTSLCACFLQAQNQYYHDIIRDLIPELNKEQRQALEDRSVISFDMLSHPKLPADNNHSVTVMCGLPFSGKSALAQRMSNERENTVVLSLSDLKKQCPSGMSLEQHVQQSIFDALLSGKDVIYDATNLSFATRQSLYNFLKDIGVHEINLAYVEVPVGEVIRNAKDVGVELRDIHEMNDLLLQNDPKSDSISWDNIQILQSIYNSLELGWEPDDLS